MTRRYRIAVLKGDGIGPEVVSSAVRVLEAGSQKSGLSLEFIDLPIGLEAYREKGRTLPPETLEGMKLCSGWILGPLQAGSYPKDDKDYPMASGKIRKAFDLFANIRPIKSLLNGASSVSRKDIDFVIVRENTEGFYPDRNLFRGYGEFWPNEDTVLSLRVVTRKACRKIAKVAFELARARKRSRLVTAVHKGNVLIEGDGLFLSEVGGVGKSFPDIKLEDRLVDTASMELILSPERFDVLVTTNLFGDILSDEAAALVGGLGLAPSLNAGEKYAMAQAVHGSAPDIAGKGIANPVAEILSSAMLLDWLYSDSSGKNDESLFATARMIEDTVRKQIASADPRDRTIDLGGRSGTDEFTSRLVAKLRS
jgi:3-isopropylmalate dehydrogenase